MTQILRNLNQNIYIVAAFCDFNGINEIFSVIYLLVVAMMLPYYIYKIKNSLHILQQNSYLSGKFLLWAIQNPSKNIKWFEMIPLLMFLILLVIISFYYLVTLPVLYGIAYLVLFFVRNKTKAKKPLVVTARVKRLIVTIIFLTLAFVIIGLYLIRMPYIILIVLALLSFAPPFAFLIVALANLINRPIELMINQWYYNDAKRIMKSAKGMAVIGITGSYGKTSSKFILSRILSEKFNVLMTPESYNTTMGVIKTIRTMLKPEHNVFVCEMGAKYKNDIKEICDLVTPEYGVITSIGPQHLETFKTIDTIIDTKFELVDALADKSKSVLNFNSPLITQNPKSKSAIGYGIDKTDGVAYWAEEITYGAFGSSFTLIAPDANGVQLETRLLGRHNILNIIGAVAMARQLGVDYDKIAYAVKRLESVSHRLELKRQSGGVTIIDDAFNSNPEGAKSAVEVLGSFPKGGRILITPGIVELGDKEYECNKEFGVHSAKFCDFIILVGKKQTIPIHDGLKEANFPQENIYVASNLQDALAKMRQIATEGSTVLFENDLPDLYNEN